MENNSIQAWKVFNERVKDIPEMISKIFSRIREYMKNVIGTIKMRFVDLMRKEE